MGLWAVQTYLFQFGKNKGKCILFLINEREVKLDVNSE